MSTENSIRGLDSLNPYPAYQQMRKARRPRWDSSLRGWVEASHAGCVAVETDSELFAHPYDLVEDLPSHPTVPAQRERSLFFLQGEDHAALHRYLVREFAPRALTDFTDSFLRQRVRHLLEPLRTQGRIEFATAVADHLPIVSIAHRLGLPWDDEAFLERCRDLTAAIVHWNETFGEGADAIWAARESIAQLDELLLPYVRERISKPREDLISRLWLDGPRFHAEWGERDVVANCRTLLHAGSWTTSALLTNIAYMMATHPSARRKVHLGEVSPSVFVEETLRFTGVVHFRVRVATRDTTLSDRPISKGDRIVTLNGSANRDGRHWKDAQHFRLDRQAPSHHLSFNRGPRTCPGAGLARAEGIAVAAELSSFDLSLDPPRPDFAGINHRSFRPLHLRASL